MAHMPEEALSTNQIEKTLESLLPDHRGYNQLRNTLGQYQEISKEGGWPVERIQSVLTGSEIVQLCRIPQSDADK